MTTRVNLREMSLFRRVYFSCLIIIIIYTDKLCDIYNTCVYFKLNRNTLRGIENVEYKFELNAG